MFFAGFNITGIDGCVMDSLNGLLLAICIAAAAAAGCTTIPQVPATAVPTPLPGEQAAGPSLPVTGATVVCSEDSCSFDPSAFPAGGGTSLSIDASPKRYSPMMSSTPGVSLRANATGFNVSTAELWWNASYGRFLTWNAPDYTVNERGASVTGTEEPLYWSFLDKPASVENPVTITLVAKDKSSGLVLGTSTVTLAWDGDYAVTVQDTV
jgi:hypothetical protein